jgi:uncharacterized membrane protein (UPF0182 family)
MLVAFYLFEIRMWAAVLTWHLMSELNPGACALLTSHYVLSYLVHLSEHLCFSWCSLEVASCSHIADISHIQFH